LQEGDEATGEEAKKSEKNQEATEVRMVWQSIQSPS